MTMIHLRSLGSFTTARHIPKKDNNVEWLKKQDDNKLRSLRAEMDRIRAGQSRKRTVPEYTFVGIGFSFGGKGSKMFHPAGNLLMLTSTI